MLLKAFLSVTLNSGYKKTRTRFRIRADHVEPGKRQNVQCYLAFSGRN